MLLHILIIVTILVLYTPYAHGVDTGYLYSHSHSHSHSDGGSTAAAAAAGTTAASAATSSVHQSYNRHSYEESGNVNHHYSYSSSSSSSSYHSTHGGETYYYSSSSTNSDGNDGERLLREARAMVLNNSIVVDLLGLPVEMSMRPVQSSSSSRSVNGISVSSMEVSVKVQGAMNAGIVNVDARSDSNGTLKIWKVSVTINGDNYDVTNASVGERLAIE